MQRTTETDDVRGRGRRRRRRHNQPASRGSRLAGVRAKLETGLISRKKPQDRISLSRTVPVASYSCLACCVFCLCRTYLFIRCLRSYHLHSVLLSRLNAIMYCILTTYVPRLRYPAIGLLRRLRLLTLFRTLTLPTLPTSGKSGCSFSVLMLLKAEAIT